MGEIITFYSFKGGTGRSMALANVAWILACNGKKVLVIDWDLEAPGMHRYFRPFLPDPDLTSSRGLIDFVIEYALKAVTPASKSPDLGQKWYAPFTDIISYAYSLEWSFPDGATIDFVPAGKQDASYARNVNSFNWENLYESLGGYSFFEEVRQKVSESYDYVLIDSRTGVSDTSGICTIQMPDTMVVCFTLNNQSIEGASAIAQTVVEKRRQNANSRPLRILPVPTRLRHSEVELLARRERYAQVRFESFVSDMTAYWPSVGVPDVDYYTYEEVLAVFRDAPGKADTVLAAFERLTGLITNNGVSALPSFGEYDRERVLEAFRNRMPLACRGTRKDFFVSYTGSDRAWAEWVAWELENAGYTTVLASRDFNAGANFITELDRSLSESERVIALLSPDYLASPNAQAEWTSVFFKDPAGLGLLPIRIREVELPGMLKSLVFVDLVGVGEKEARERLLKVASRGRKAPLRQLAFPSDQPKPERFPGSLPDIWNLPVPRALDFFGRDDTLVKLREALQRRERGSTVSITGLGGVGKTTLAAEYAYRYAADYDVVWWVRAENASVLAGDFSVLAGLLHLQTSNQPLAVDASLTWLRHNRKWLLVFDNAADLETIRPFIPEPTIGHVIITSRNPLWRAKSQVLPLEVLAREASLAFLEKRTGHADKASADALAERLGDLPLALEHAAAYMEESELSVADYLRLTRDFASDLLETVTAAFQLSIEKVRSESPVAGELLNVIAFLESGSIPRTLLEPIAPSPLEFNKRVTSLRRYSLVESKESSISAHRLIQQTSRDCLTEQDRRPFVEIAVDLVNRAFPSEVFDPANWIQCKTILPHVLASTGYAEQLGVGLEQASDVLNRAGIYLSEQAQFGQAEALLRRALSISERVFDDPHLANRLNNLGKVLMDRGELEGALTHVQRALAIHEKVYGPDHPSVSASLNSLGQILILMGNLDEALPHVDRALAIDEKVYGPNHPLVAVSLSNLGQISTSSGNLDLAQRYFRRALAIDEKVYGPDHPSVANRLRNLGQVFAGGGNVDGAIPLFQRALGIYESTYGPDHPNVARVLNNLGLILHSAGDLEGALTYLRRALAIDEKIFGPHHSSVAEDLKNLRTISGLPGQP